MTVQKNHRKSELFILGKTRTGSSHEEDRQSPQSLDQYGDVNSGVCTVYVYSGGLVENLCNHLGLSIFSNSNTIKKFTCLDGKN